MANNAQDRPQGAINDPEEWVTGSEPMTGAPDSYLHTLAREAGEELPDDMTKAEASEKIEELQERTDRGQGSNAKSRRTANRWNKS
jgi:hypothetical protein